MKLTRWLRLFHTIRHLQPRQAVYFFLRRGIGARTVATSTTTPPRRAATLDPVLQLSHDSRALFSAFEFRFLNQTLNFPRDAMNWCPREVPRLWRYNLHYFDFLRDPIRPLSQKQTLIDDWIAHNPQGSEPAWEPYTASLRIVNWCLFFWSLPEQQIPERWARSLHTQARWLEKNLELHILANHYFENIKAMLFAAFFFNDDSANRWLTRYQKALAEQLREQTLADGGHYERSPQYHCILLDDYLDIYALLRQNPALTAARTLADLKRVIAAGLQWLSTLATPDDDIPLFNDSASGSAARPSTIFAKARALGFIVQESSCALIDLPHSGLFGWKCGGDYFLIDCGAIGPAYQPGHTHCDFLSFVLMVDGQWLIVDSGVSEYEPGAMRQYVRSTAAHNTVIVDGTEQSEVWGEFRVGRRARSLGASITHSGNDVVFEGAFLGFPTISGGMVHRRRAVLSLNADGTIRSVAIEDNLDGSRAHSVALSSLVHLHPAIGAEPVSDARSVTLTNQGETIAAIGVDAANCNSGWQRSGRASWFCPEFGLKQANIALEIATVSKLPTRLAYEIICTRKG